MTLRTLLISAAIALTCSCSIKENRNDCPCRLTIDLSDASEENGNIIVSVRGNSELLMCEEVKASDRIKHYDVPKSRIMISCLQGIEDCKSDGRNVLIPYGKKADRIHTGIDSTDCRHESAYCFARFKKNWATLELECLTPGTSSYPYDIIVSGNVNGFDMFTLTPSEGQFRCPAKALEHQSENPDVLKFHTDLPRQFPEGKGLALTLIKKTDHIPEKEYDLSGILTGKKFDWSATSLNDVSITLDYSGNIISVSIIDWQSGMESDIVI